MQNHFTQEMDSLKTSLQQMVELVDGQVCMAFEALEKPLWSCVAWSRSATNRRTPMKT